MLLNMAFSPNFILGKIPTAEPFINLMDLFSMLMLSLVVILLVLKPVDRIGMPMRRGTWHGAEVVFFSLV